MQLTTSQKKAVDHYYKELSAYQEKKVTHETAVRSAFQNLLAAFAQSANWVLIPEQTLAPRLAASLIDAETFTIPLQIPWLMAIVAIIVHTVIDDSKTPNHLNVDPHSVSGPIALGGGIGLIISIVLFLVGIIPQSFAEGEPALPLIPNQN